MVPNMSSMKAPEAVVKTTSGVVSDDKVGIMTIPSFRCNDQIVCDISVLAHFHGIIAKNRYEITLHYRITFDPR